MKFTIGVLTYGNYPELTARCLDSLSRLAEWEFVDEVRIGLNEPSLGVRAYVHSWAGNAPVPVRTFACAANAFKYPLMRRMLVGVTSPAWMWFDDDSFLTAPGVLSYASGLLEHSDVVGKPYRLKLGLTERQKAWVQAQPWYAGVSLDDRAWFPQGAWWAAKTAVLTKFDWPSVYLKHRGGDVMFGELIRQQQLKMTDWYHGVAINADAQGRHSMSPRRGYDEKPVGVSWYGEPPPDYLQTFFYDEEIYQPKPENAWNAPPTS